jgi:hypothetical protein
MKMKGWVGVSLLGITMIGFVSAASAQAADTARMDRMGALAKHWQAQLGPNTNRLSSGAQNFLHLGEQWNNLKAAAAAMAAGGSGGPPVFGSLESQVGLPEMGGPPRALAPGHPISVPNIAATRFSGAVQSETSTAWCDKQAVTGFNDSGSFWETGGFFPAGGQSLEGHAVSTNSGGTFTDKGFPTVGPVGTAMLGDPVLACSNSSDFFYASLFEDGSVPGPSDLGFSDISLSLSTNGGSTFGAPIVAVAKDAFFHFLDKPWMTLDPSHPNIIYITYTDFDSSNFGAGSPGNSCGGSHADIPRTAIELVSSTNGGTTWSSPSVVVEVCGDPFVQGSQVAVDKTGKVYVAWESFASNNFIREIDIASSIDGGLIFGAPVKVGGVAAVGGGDFAGLGLQGFIRDFEFPSLTIGKGKKNAGALYITWNDGDKRVTDAILTAFGIGDGKYGFSDVFFSSSTNGGATWSSPVTVNAASKSPADHYQPGVATDKNGRIAVCWYDRRRDPNNFLIDRECGSSTDGGAKWSNKKITPKNYASVVAQDFLINPTYMGDYDQLTTDATDKKAGFLGGFVNTQAGNQNVQANKP